MLVPPETADSLVEAAVHPQKGKGALPNRVCPEVAQSKNWGTKCNRKNGPMFTRVEPSYHSKRRPHFYPKHNLITSEWKTEENKGRGRERGTEREREREITDLNLLQSVISFPTAGYSKGP